MQHQNFRPDMQDFFSAVMQYLHSGFKYIQRVEKDRSYINTWGSFTRLHGVGLQELHCMAMIKIMMVRMILIIILMKCDMR